MNSLGTAIIDHAEFIVNDQTIETISGEFIRAFFNIYGDINNLIGISADAVGNTPIQNLNTFKHSLIQIDHTPQKMGHISVYYPFSFCEHA